MHFLIRFSHAIQMELSMELRKILRKQPATRRSFFGAIYDAWQDAIDLESN